VQAVVQFPQHDLVLVADAHDLFDLAYLALVILGVGISPVPLGPLELVRDVGQPVQQALLGAIAVIQLLQQGQ